MSKKTDKQPSNQDIIAAIHGFADDIEERFATKKDLKEELVKYATKADLKEELTKYATKKDLKQTEDRLMIVLDKIVVNTQRLDTERVAHRHWLERHEKILQTIQS